MKFKIKRLTKNGQTIIPWIYASSIYGLENYIKQVVKKMKERGEI